MIGLAKRQQFTLPGVLAPQRVLRRIKFSCALQPLPEIQASKRIHQIIDFIIIFEV
jgi:hypothetical protein